MRFGVPRSPSTSPIRRPRRTKATRRRQAFGLAEDSSSDEVDASDSSYASSSSSSSDSDVDAKPKPLTKLGKTRTTAEIQYIEEAVAAIRLRTRHQDPYEEWEKETRRDAFRTARKHQSAVRTHHQTQNAQSQAAQLAQRTAHHKQQADAVAAQLAAFEKHRQREEQMLKEQWKARDKELWTRIEGVIKVEEEKVRRQVEEERRKREEEERKRKEAEERKRAEEQRRRDEEERKRKEAEEKSRKEKEEQEAERKQEEERKAREQASKAQESQRKTLGATTAAEDWVRARRTLKELKDGPIKTVKADSAMSKLLGQGRRAITPKVGQLTNDAQSVERISQELLGILQPSPAHPPPVYAALLSCLSKSLLLQAETEVTATPRAAVPLAQVTVRLLSVLTGFADVLWARMCQRAGGWPAPYIVPSVDVDGTPFDKASRRKAMGYRGEEEQASERWRRIEGIGRFYFAVCKESRGARQPVDVIFRFPRCWTYFARLLDDEKMRASPIAAMVLHAALDVVGIDAKQTWGKQWIKLLGLLYEGVTKGVGGGKFVGGDTPEGKSARVRVQLEIERIMNS